MKVSNGTVKAISRTTGKLLAAWPVIITKEVRGEYAVRFPLLPFKPGEFYARYQDAAESIVGGNDWVRIEVEWSTK